MIFKQINALSQEIYNYDLQCELYMSDQEICFLLVIDIRNVWKI